MKIDVAAYQAQKNEWPEEGRHIMAHYDAQSVIVYQAYKPVIARFALAHGYLGGPEFGLSRMSWVKPNFLWMMYRSGWGTKEGQEMTLALRVSRAFFDGLLQKAVSSSFDPDRYPSQEAWQAAVASSEVRLQWDPDHAPSGKPLPRRAIQLGLRGATLAAFAREELQEVIDLTDFVASQRAFAIDDDQRLLMPTERVYELLNGVS